MKIDKYMVIGALVGIYLGLIFFALERIRLFQAYEHIMSIIK